MDLFKWFLLNKLLKVKNSTTRLMNLNRFQDFLKSLDMSRTKDNYKELIKIKELQVKFFYKQQIIMEKSEHLIFLINNCEKNLTDLDNIKIDDLSLRYLNIYYYNQDLIKSFINNFELAIDEYKYISNKIELVLKDALILLFNCILNEQEYLLTKSYLTKIKNRFNNQLNELENDYNNFKFFINDKINNKITFNFDNDFNNNNHQL